jgi:hypothetical protein
VTDAELAREQPRARLGAAAWRQSIHPFRHRETPAMRDEVLGFLDALAR